MPDPLGMSATGIKSAPRPADKPVESLYRYDESSDPTNQRNFEKRLKEDHRTYYTNFVIALPPGKKKSDKALGELMPESGHVTNLIHGLEANYNTFAPHYQSIAREADQSIKQFSHSKSLESIAHRSDPKVVERMGDNLKQKRNELKHKLDVTQQAELDALKEQFFDSSTGHPKAMLSNPPAVDTLISSDDMQKMYEKAEYELKVVHANQQALLANRFNNSLEEVRKLWDNAEEASAAMIMHNLARKKDKSKAGYHTSKDQKMDGFKIHDAEEHQRIMRDNAGNPNGYNLVLDRAALGKFGASTWRLGRDGKPRANEELIINIREAGKDENGNQKYSAQCIMPGQWDSKTRLAALKAFATECKAQGLTKIDISKTYPKLSRKDQFKLIVHIREIYGDKATITGEQEIISQGIKRGELSKSCAAILNPQEQEARHAVFLKQSNLRGTHRGEIGSKTEAPLPEKMDVPDASDIEKPDWAPKTEPTSLTAKPLTATSTSAPRPGGKTPASAKLSGGQTKPRSPASAAIKTKSTGSTLEDTAEAGVRNPKPGGRGFS